ncbi:uncharacterized protein LOC131948857 [Physella acuta]|uniref:uncharacterized protein LOC131948857 n=1 Tax=Physella acuta TaxID=109671 RepID=UPI0027DB40E4|nr:uncharacterized protein LOC131948857 [Physella acuta]
MPHGAIPFPFGDCRICNDKATGFHYGVATCEGCKGFFKRSIPKGDKYTCFFGGHCNITPFNRNRCKACRFKRCLDNGMAIDAVKMGRIPKVEKERALLETRMQSQASGSMDVETDDQSPSDVWIASHERDQPNHSVSSFNKEKMCIPNPSTLFSFEKKKNHFSQDSANYSGLKQSKSMYSWMTNSETGISGPIDNQPVQAGSNECISSKNIDPALNLTSYTTYRKSSQHNTLSSFNSKTTSRSHSHGHLLHQPLPFTQFTNPVVQHTHMPSHALHPSHSTSHQAPTTNQSLQNNLTYPLEPPLLLKYPVKTEPPSFQHTLDRETVSCDNPFAQSTTSTICHSRASQVIDSFEQFQNLTPTWPENHNGFVPVQVKNEIIPDQNNIYKVQEKKIKLNVSDVTPLTKEMCKRTSYSPDVIKVLLDQVGGEKIRAMKHQIMSTVAQYVGREEYEAAKQLLKPYTDIPEKNKEDHLCIVKQTGGNEAQALFQPPLPTKSGLIKNSSQKTLQLPLTSQHPSSSYDQYLVPDVSNSSIEFDAETYFNQHVLDQTNSLDFSLSINSHSQIGSICQENSKQFELTSDDLNNLESLVTNTSTETDQHFPQENKATVDSNTSQKVSVSSHHPGSENDSPDSSNVDDLTMSEKALVLSQLFDKHLIARKKKIQNMKYYIENKISLPIHPLTPESKDKVYKLLIESIPDINKSIIGYCQEVPGFSMLAKNDKEYLIKNAYYDLWMLTNSIFFQNDECYLVLEDGTFYTRAWMERILNPNIVDKIMTFSRNFNKININDSELAILCAIQLTSSDHVHSGFENLESVHELHSTYLDLFADEIARRFPQTNRRILIDIFRYLPDLRELNKLQKEIIANLSTQQCPEKVEYAPEPSSDVNIPFLKTDTLNHLNT